jgi:hypothetical protein
MPAMGKHIGPLILIFLATTFAWFVLGSTIFARTYSASGALGGRVASTWGGKHEQSPPTARYAVVETHTRRTIENGQAVDRSIEESVWHDLSLEQSRIAVVLDLEPRQKGLLWFNTYKVAYAGDYRFRNGTDTDRTVTFSLEYPAEHALYDGLLLSLDGRSLELVNGPKCVTGTAVVPAGHVAVLHAGYRSQGLEQWRYVLGSGVAQAKDFALTMTTNFAAIDFADDTLSPTEKHRDRKGWALTWRYQNLVTGFPIAMVMPERLQPGPLAGRISYFAPVSLLFFFFLLFIITALRGIELHPMNYFFLAAAFFAFHLLLAYLADLISIHLAFAICSVVSVFLVVSYLRLVVGLRFAAVEAGLAQLVYLILFSYAFFFRGITGLAITIGAIMTLFVVMQMTGRIRWADKAAPSQPAPAAR